MAIVFVLHGMGKHEKGWWAGDNGTLANLKKLKRYDSIEDHETLQEKLMQFDWVELLYDQHIEKLRTAPNNSAGFSDLLSDIKADDNFNSPSEQVLTAWKDEWLETSESLNPFNTNDFLKDAAWDVYLVSMPLTRH
jgi:hypothetical protein